MVYLLPKTPFNQDPVEAGYFAAYLIFLFATVGLLVFAFLRCRGMRRPSRSRSTCFGFRWSLLFYAITMLIATLQVGIPNSVDLTIDFQATYVVKDAFQLAAEVTLVYATFKTLLTPLGTAGHANAWTLSAVIPFTLSALGAFALTAAYQALFITLQNSEHSDYYSSSIYDYEDIFNTVSLISASLWLLYDALSVLVGILMLVATCVAFSRWRGAPARREPRLMAAVASLWLVRSILGLAFDTVQFLPTLDYVYLYGDFEQLLNDVGIADVVLVNALAIAIYSLFCHCYRTGRDDTDAFYEDQNPELAPQYQVSQNPGPYGIQTGQNLGPFGVLAGQDTWGKQPQFQPAAAPYPQQGGPSPYQHQYQGVPVYQQQ